MKVLVSVFETFTVIQCNKGVEVTNAATVRVFGLTALYNFISAFEGKVALTRSKPPHIFGLFNSFISEDSNSLRDGASIHLPHMDGFKVATIKTYYPKQNDTGRYVFSWVKIPGLCEHHCGGFWTSVVNISISGIAKKVNFDWEAAGLIIDTEGGFMAHERNTILHCEICHDRRCYPIPNETNICACPRNVKFTRFSFNKAVPEDLRGRNLTFKSAKSYTTVPYREKGVTHHEGWTVILKIQETYNITFDGTPAPKNFSFDGTMNPMLAGQEVTLLHSVMKKPAKVYLYRDNDTSINVTWSFSDSSNEIQYTLKGGHETTGESLPRLQSEYVLHLQVRIFECKYKGCDLPVSPRKVTSEPKYAQLWSRSETWEDRLNGKPAAGDYVTIPPDKWIILDESPPVLQELFVNGGLSVKSDPELEVVLQIHSMVIMGKVVAGWSEEAPLPGHLRIIVLGNDDGMIWVYGSLILNGRSEAVTKTRITSPVRPRSSMVEVEDIVQWPPESEIILTSTDYEPRHTELFTINSTLGNRIKLKSEAKFSHNAYTLTVNGTVRLLAAKVALLARNIHIIGLENKPTVVETSAMYGPRIFVGSKIYNSDLYEGEAHLSSVLFLRTGNGDPSMTTHPRFTLTFWSGTSTKHYSQVRNCIFQDGYDGAILVVDTPHVELSGNVVYGCKGTGILVMSKNVTLRGNLVVMSTWSSKHLSNMRHGYYGAIDAIHSKNLTLINNIVMGSERVGFTLPGQPCGSDDAPWEGNEAHHSLIGVGIFPRDPAAHPQCVIFEGFFLWKNLDFGIYYHNVPSVIFSGNVLIDNGLGIFPAIIGIPNESHKNMAKYCEIYNNTFVGRTPTFSPIASVSEEMAFNLAKSSFGRVPGSKELFKKIGVMITSFTNCCRTDNVQTLLSYQCSHAIRGRTQLHGNLFAKYHSLGIETDHAIANNPTDEGATNPIYVENLVFEDVPINGRVHFFTENLTKITTGECKHFPCDAKRKVMLVDKDGSLLNFKGFVLPKSVRAWGDNLGSISPDPRIPKQMLFKPGGGKREFSVLASHKGIFKADLCDWVRAWQAYSCEDHFQWRMLMIKGLPSTRHQLGPVAVYNPEGYVDLLHGPKMICKNKNCSLPLGRDVYQAIVVLGEQFNIYFSSFDPVATSYELEYSRNDECVLLSMERSQYHQTFIEVNGTVITAVNQEIQSSGTKRIIHIEESIQDALTMLQWKHGHNLISSADSHLYWVQCGGSEVTVYITQALLLNLRFSALSETSEESIVSKLVDHFQIRPSLVEYETEIYVDHILPIPDDMNNTNTSDIAENMTHMFSMMHIAIAKENVEDDSNMKDQMDLAETIIEQAVLGNLEEIIDHSLENISIVMAVNGSRDIIDMTPQIPKSLVLLRQPSFEVYSGQIFEDQPILEILDVWGRQVQKTDTANTPWRVEVSIEPSGDNIAELLGLTEAQFISGTAVFTNLIIVGYGVHILRFKISWPHAVQSLETVSKPISVLISHEKVNVHIGAKPALTNRALDLTVTFYQEFVPHINFNGPWTVNTSVANEDIYHGKLKGQRVANVHFGVQKTADFQGLQMTVPGKCPVLFTLFNPAGVEIYNFTSMISAISPEQEKFNETKSHKLALRISLEMKDEIVIQHWSALIRNRYSNFTKMRVMGDEASLDNMTSDGGVLVTINIEATTEGYERLMELLCGDIGNLTNFTLYEETISLQMYLDIDGNPSYLNTCLSINNTSDGLSILGLQKPLYDALTLASGATFIFYLIAVTAILLAILLLQQKNEVDLSSAHEGNESIVENASRPSMAHTYEDLSDSGDETFSFNPIFRTDNVDGASVNSKDPSEPNADIKIRSVTSDHLPTDDTDIKIRSVTSDHLQTDV